MHAGPKTVDEAPNYTTINSGNCATFRVRVWPERAEVVVLCDGCDDHLRRDGLCGGEIPIRYGHLLDDANAYAMARAVCAWMERHAHRSAGLLEENAREVFSGPIHREAIKEWAVSAMRGDSELPGRGWHSVDFGNDDPIGYRLEPTIGGRPLL